MSTPAMSKPRSSIACRIVRPSATWNSRPSMVSFGMTLELEALRERALLLVDVRLEVGAKVFQEALDRPGSGVGEGADRLALHQRRHIVEQREILGPAAPPLDALAQLVYPARALAALRALTAGLVAEEVGSDTGDAHHAGRLVHPHHAAGAQVRALRHEQLLGQADVELRRRQDRHRETAGHDALQAPAAAHASGHAQHFAQRGAERQLEQTGPLDVARDTEQCRTGALLGAALAEPLDPALEDERHVREGLDVVHRRRQAEGAVLRRERRLLARLALLSLE